MRPVWTISVFTSNCGVAQCTEERGLFSLDKKDKVRYGGNSPLRIHLT